MDRATVIAALPPVGDRINKISSEAVPHLTLLYLGEADLSEDAILYVQHACAELSPFGLSVDYRGELGADKADVLFFEKTAWDLERVSEFRHHLLLNDEIKRAFDAADQYPEWTPHLTLGYPEAPAREKEDEDVYMGYVQFDRIAVWLGDFSGPEFRLKYDDMMDVAVSMSEMSTAQRGEHAVGELFHFGVKGMKWGIRKDRSGGGGGAAKPRGAVKRGLTKANVALNAGSKVIDKGEKKLIFLPQDKRDKAASGTQTRILGEAAAINRQPQFKGKDLKTSPQLKASYHRAVEKKALDIYQEELTKQRVEYTKEIFDSIMNPGGTRLDVTAPRSSMRHSDENDELLASFEFTLNELGQITDADLVHSDLAHRDVSADERKELKKKGAAKPDESFPIANAEDLSSAIKLAKSDSDRRHVIKNAKRLGLEDKIPDTWNADGTLEHSEMTTFDRGEKAVAELFHYGKKGMKWGVTTKDGATSATQTREKTSHLVRGAKDVQVSQRKAGTYVKAKGGQRQTAHDDAVRAQAGRRVAKKSTTDALSNKQLKDTIERMRLEQEYSKLDSKVSRKGQSFVARLFRSPEMRSVAADMAKKVTAKAGAA